MGWIDFHPGICLFATISLSAVIPSQLLSGGTGGSFSEDKMPGVQSCPFTSV
jgi:hypothetical protein